MNLDAYAVIKNGDFSRVAQGIFYVFPTYSEAHEWATMDVEEVVRIRITTERAGVEGEEAKKAHS